MPTFADFFEDQQEFQIAKGYRQLRVMRDVRFFVACSAFVTVPASPSLDTLSKPQLVCIPLGTQPSRVRMSVR